MAQSPPSTTAPGSLKRTGEETVGASISHPAEWLVEREQYTLDNTYGFTMWKPAPDPSSDADDSDDHGETTPAVRVARVSGLRPGQIEQRVRARLEEYSDL